MQVRRFACGWDFGIGEYAIVEVVGEEGTDYFTGEFDVQARRIFGLSAKPGIPMQFIAKTPKGAVSARKKLLRKQEQSYISELAAVRKDIRTLQAMCK